MITVLRVEKNTQTVNIIWNQTQQIYQNTETVLHLKIQIHYQLQLNQVCPLILCEHLINPIN